MIAPLAKMLDWTAIQKHFSRWPSVRGLDLRLKEAVQLATGADFVRMKVQKGVARCA